MNQNVYLFSTLSAATKFAENLGEKETSVTFRGLWLVYPRPTGMMEGFTVVLSGALEVSWLNRG
jgi:hypothetical protein